MTQPVPQRQPVDYSGVVEFVVVVAALALVVVGFWTALNWSWGLVALGGSLLVAVKWAGRGGAK